EKDQWHKGDYKQQPNSVDAHYQDGSTVTIFSTATPGMDTEKAMKELFNWYNADKSTPAIIKVAVFVYEFLSIHPFQDGNGRLSRLLATLLLLKHGYSWIQYVSFEHEIENRKKEYYKVLMDCQQNRPEENINSWVHYFLNCLNNIQAKLMQKLEVRKSENKMSPREKMIFAYVDNHPGAKSGEIASNLNIPLPTVKRILSEMTAAKFLAKYGSGVGTNYTTENLMKIKNNIVMNFISENRSQEFHLKSKHTFIEIKKIILTPKFEWNRPDDWGRILIDQNPVLIITCTANSGEKRIQKYWIAGFNSAYYYEPVFTLNSPINVPGNLWEGIPHNGEFPIEVQLYIESRGDELKFDIMIVYDASLE
ncbi:MAG: Fic family protein, partial [Bacteroidia bacterium]